MKKLAAIVLASVAWTIPTLAQDSQYKPVNQQIPPPTCLTLKGAREGGYTPCTDVTHQLWLSDVTHWRTERRIRIGFDDARYRLPALQWAQSGFIQPQMMVQDRYFYDPVAHKYTVDRYLDDLDKRYGGIDAVLIWPTYPNMGIDDRARGRAVLCQHRLGAVFSHAQVWCLRQPLAAGGSHRLDDCESQ
jgi:iron(II)-dependent oxidoreductase